MKIQYSQRASQLMEQFALPFFLRDKSEMLADFSNKEQEILQDIFPIMEELRLLYLPYKEKMNRYYLTGYGLTLLQAAYLEMTDQGLEAESAEAVHSYCLQLTEEEIRTLLKDLLNTEPEHMEEDGDFWDYLEASTAKAESKWYFSQFYRNPLKSMQELVRLSRELITLYQPYLEKGEAERRTYSETFSLENTMAKSVSLAHFDWNLRENQQIKLYIVSPWLVLFMAYSSPSKAEKASTQHFILSCRIDQLLEQEQVLDMDTFTTVLKTISDATRYNVLVELTKPHAKSKQIAEELDITGAAVSFHTQKLINAKLLLFNREDKNVKYDVNKNLLQEIIAKLTSDFDLD